MPLVIGTVNSVKGLFFIKDADGNITTAKSGDTINSGDIVFGDTANSSDAAVSVLLNDNSNEITVTNNNQLTFDETMLTNETSPYVIAQNDEFNEDLFLDESTWTFQNKTTADTEEEFYIEEEEELVLQNIEGLDAPDAGQPENSEVLNARFENRTGNEVDISTDLKDTASQSSEISEYSISNENIVFEDTDVVLTFSDIIVDEESGTALVGAELTVSPIDEPLVVTLNNGATITFGTDYEAGTIILSTLFSVNEDENPVIEVESFSGGSEFENLDISDSATESLEETVIDTNDTPKLTINDVNAGEEADTATVTGSLNRAPDTELVVTLSIVGAMTTMTFGTDYTPGDIISSSPFSIQEDNQDINKEVIISITETSGGNFEFLDTTDTAVLTIQDTTGSATLTIKDVNISEETNTIATIEASLDKTPETEFVVTLNNGATLTFGTTYIPGDIILSTEFEINNDEDINSDESTSEILIESISGGNFESVDISDTLSVTVTDTTDTTDTNTVTNTLINNTATLTLNDVTLNEGSGTVTVTGSLDNTPETTLVITLNNGATITFLSSYTPGTLISSIPFSVQDDDVFVDLETIVLSVSGISGGNFESLDTSDTSTVTINDTIDTVYARIVGNDFDVEGSTLTHTVELYTLDGATKVPFEVPVGESMTVTIGYDLASSDSARTPQDYTETTTVVITGGNYSATVSVITNDDMQPNEGDEFYTAEITNVAYSGSAFEDLQIISDTVTGTISDNDGFNLFDKIVLNEISLQAQGSTPAYIEIISTTIDASETIGPVMSRLGLEIVGENGQVIVIDAGFTSDTLPAKGYLMVYEDGTWEMYNAGLSTPYKSGTWHDHATLYDDANLGGIAYDPLTHTFDFGATTASSLSVNLLQTDGGAGPATHAVDYFSANNPSPDVSVTSGVWSQPTGDINDAFLSFDGAYTNDTVFERVFKEDASVQTDSDTITDWATTSLPTPYDVNNTQLDASDPFAPDAADGQTVLFAGDGGETLQGEDGADFLFGGSGGDIIFGGDGNDYIDGGAGSDTIDAGAGDDRLLFDGNDTKIDGGSDSSTDDDVLILISGDDIDFSALDNSVVKNIDTIDLTANGNHTLNKLTLQDVMDITDSADGTLKILGDGSDAVILQNGTGNWTSTATETIDSVTYDSYTNSEDPSYKVLIQENIVDSTL